MTEKDLRLRKTLMQKGKKFRFSISINNNSFHKGRHLFEMISDIVLASTGVEVGRILCSKDLR